MKQKYQPKTSGYLFVRHFVSFGEAPFSAVKKPSSLRHRFDGCRKNLFKKIQDSLAAKLRGRLILMERCRAQVFFIQCRRLIYMTDVIRQVLQGSKIMGVDKGLGIKVTGGLPVAPKNGNRIDRQGVVHFFCRPTQPFLVFECQGESVGPENVQLCGRSGKRQITSVVKTTAGGMHPPPSIQGVEKLRPLSNGPIHVTGEQGTKSLLGGKNVMPILSAPDQGLGRAVKCKNRDMKLPWVR